MRNIDFELLVLVLAALPGLFFLPDALWFLLGATGSWCYYLLNARH
jgi:hypothetical protein